MAKLSASLPVSSILFLVTFICRELSAFHIGRIKDQCEDSPFLPPPILLPPSVNLSRPNYTEEGLLYSEEVISGKTCFTLDVYPHRRLNTFHISLYLNDYLDICQKINVREVELLALAHFNKRTTRKPFGRMFRSEMENYDGINLTCGHTQPEDLHVNYTNINQGSGMVWADCKFRGGGFVIKSASNSIRIQNRNSGNLGVAIGNQTLVACALWAYDANVFNYPREVNVNQSIYMEFIAELAVTGPGGPGLRSIAKISRIDQQVITMLVPKLLCTYLSTTTTIATTPTTTVTTMSTTTTTANSTLSSNKTSSSTTAPTTTTTTTTTTAAPVYENRPCVPHGSCQIVQNYLKVPQGDVYTSFYDPILSDACRCDPNMPASFTFRKYNYGGLHYGYPLPPPPTSNMMIPYVPVVDPIFKTCLQFHFDLVTGCAVFIIDDCSVANPTVTGMDLYEFNIFALSSTSNDSMEGLPFGGWESVDQSVGNCGNLITGKRTQLYTRKHRTEACPSHGYKVEKFGMPIKPSDIKVPIRPKIWRNKLDPSLELFKAGSKPTTTYAYAARLHNLEFNKADPMYRPLYLTFVLELVTKLTTKYTQGALPSDYFQVISMKTPLATTNYLNNSGTGLDLQVLPINPNTLLVDYLHLSENWHDHMFYRDECPKNGYGFSTVITQPIPIPAVDSGVESTCKCYGNQRTTTSQTFIPTDLTEFITQVAGVTNPQHTLITEDCFVFGFDPVVSELPDPVPGSNFTVQVEEPDGCVDGYNKLHRARVYFGMKCAGPEALEVMDMTIMAINHKGYPVGFWENINFDTEAKDCEKELVTKSAGAGSKSWQIRAIKAIWDYTCPPQDLEDVYGKPFDAQETFLHDKPPHMLLFNHNLTIEADKGDKNFGFCSWWYFRTRDKYHVTHDMRNFYLDFQFVATMFIEHRPSQTTYLVTLRQDRIGLNVKTCNIDKLNPSPTFKNIYLNKKYYLDHVDESRGECIVPINRIDTFATGICGCYILASNEKTYRLDASIYPKNHSLSERITVLQQCIVYQFSLANNPLDYSIIVRWKLEDSVNCKGFLIYEVLLQAIDDTGLPTGYFDKTLINQDKTCKVLGNAQVKTFSCPVSPIHKDKYKTDKTKIDVFQFQNIWEDEDVKWICARWNYPKDWAMNAPDNDLPQNFQFYSQANIYDRESNTWLTAPKFTQKKVKFEQSGKFTKEIIKDPSWHIKDFNNYLTIDFQKESDPARPCLMKYPPLRAYRSYMCRMFHPPAHTQAPPYRVDLDDEYNENTEFTRYKNCYNFIAYPGNWPLTFHLTFRQLPQNPDCPPAIHFALTAYNEIGFPIGKPVSGSGGGGNDEGWTHYDHPFVTGNRLCENEDLEVKSDSILPVDAGQCPFYSLPEIGLNEGNMTHYYKQRATLQELPGMIALGVTPTVPPDGICFHWIYEPQRKGQITPKFIQFYLEFFVPFSPENTVSGTEFILRSKKFSMDYTAGSTLPPPAAPPKNCHDENDRNKIFKVVPVPNNDKWAKMYNYTIYPHKLTYRKCRDEFYGYKTCVSKFKDDEVAPPTLPVVIIPGLLGPDEDNYLHRYNTTAAIYDGCVAGKRCFAPVDFFKGDQDSNCLSEMNCQLVWAVGKQPIHPRDKHLPDPEDQDEFVLELYAATRGWVAMGLSFDREMGDDFVLECVKNVTEEVDGKTNPQAFFSWNIDRSSTNRRIRDNLRYLKSETKDIARLVLRRYDENSIYCVFYIQSSFQVRSRSTQDIFTYDLRSDSYCVLTAYGGLFKMDKNKTITGIGSHVEGVWNGEATCRDSTDLSRRLTPTRSQVKVLQYHGLIMTIAYLCLLSVSVFVVRYYKYTLPLEIYGYPLWVWIHAMLAVVASILVIIGWILFSTGKRQWVSPLTSPFHRFIGYNSIVLTLVNLPVGYYIRRTEGLHDKHSIFYLIHGVGGHFATVSGIFIVAVIAKVEYAFVPCSVGYVGIGFTLAYLLINCVMSFNRYWLNKLVASKEEYNDKSYKVTPFILFTQNAPKDTNWHEEYPKARKIRLIILGAFGLFVWSFTIPIIYLSVTSDHSCILEMHFMAVNT